MSFIKKNIITGNPENSSRLPLGHKRSWIWILSAILVLSLNYLLPVSIFEKLYYQGLFTWIRQSYDFLLGWSPLPMIYVVAAIVLVRTFKWFAQWNKGFSYQMLRALGGVAALVVLFYILWGFNYNQVSLQSRMGFNLQSVSATEISREFQRATEVLKNESASLPEKYTSDEAIMNSKITDADIRDDVENALHVLHLPNKGRVRVRQLWPNGFLLRWSTAGIYIPQSCEGHIDKGLLSVQKPFSIAHEMAHGYGVTDEGACNFIAWLACTQSDNPWIKFGGALTYWRYAAAEMPSDSVGHVLQTLPPVVRTTLSLIRENDSKYPDLLPEVRDAVYSSYLKRHGVQGGLRSYNYVVMMVQQYLKAQSASGPPE